MLERFETSAEKAIFVGLAAMSVLAVAVASASLRSRIGSASPGFVVWQNLVVPAIDPIGAAGVRVPPRTVVVAVDGTPVRDAAALGARVGAVTAGTPLGYTFRRGGRETSVRVPTIRLRWRDVGPVALPYLLEGAALLATALVIFLFRPGEPGARAGVALGTIAGLMQILAVDLFSAAWLERVYFVVESLVPAALLHFALCFPEPKGVVRRHPALVWLPYVACLPFAILQNVWLTVDPERHLGVNDWVYTAAAAAGLASMGALVHGLFTARTALARQQVKIVLAGMAAAVFVPALGLVAIILLGLDVPMNVLTPFFLLYPLSIAYAVARHDLFHVDRYLKLGVVWAALTIVVFVTYAAVVLAGQLWLGRGTPVSHGLVPLYVVAMLLVANPLRARIQAGVDRLFHRQGYDYRATVDATSRALASVLDADRIATTVLRTLTEVMTAEWAVLVVYADPPAAAHVYGRPDERGARTRRVLGESVERAGAVRALATVWRREGTSGRPERADAVLRELDVALALPLRFEDRPVGLLLLGASLSTAYYGDDDLDLLTTLCNQSALALVNARAAEVIRRTQRELAEAERMAAVGELAAAVAHGIRNPLAGIRSAAEVARDGLGSHDGEIAESLDDIIGEADRLETRVRTILDFTRPIRLDLVPGDLAVFAQAFVDEFRARLPPGIGVEAEAEPDLPLVPFDAGALREVVETIAVNAVEALGERGTIRLHVGRSHENGQAAVLTVSDDGPGMDAATRQRAFDLFYTTKHTGTGVGLAMARRLIERQGGAITVDSTLGAGTTFRIRLPLAAPLNARTS